MEFNVNLRELFKKPISKIDSSLIPEGIPYDRRLRNAFQTVCEIIDQMGIASAKAQGLMKPITSADKLRVSEHTLYVYVDHEARDGKGCVVAILKVGRKRLYVFDSDNQCHNVEALCVLDFYVHESRQRLGVGRYLFDHMLTEEHVKPEKLAIDKPSDKFLSFLSKHYLLQNAIPQTNNFVIYDGFFVTKMPHDAEQFSDGSSEEGCDKNSPMDRCHHSVVKTPENSYDPRRLSSSSPWNSNRLSGGSSGGIRQQQPLFIGRHAAHKPETTIGQIIHSSPVM